ncbi:MAG: DoxX family protein [Gammaproteobacteria bacterium]|nr:DoxX family protein [Gammaproteobacteria bacterium]
MTKMLPTLVWVVCRGGGDETISLEGVRVYPPGTAQFFASIGLPAVLAYPVFFAEAIGGILLIAGVHARGVALALVPVLIGAAWVHWPNGWLFSNPNGGWEYPVFLTIAAVAQTLLGDGAFAVSGKRIADRAAAVAAATEA